MQRDGDFDFSTARPIKWYYDDFEEGELYELDGETYRLDEIRFDCQGHTRVWITKIKPDGTDSKQRRLVITERQMELKRINPQPQLTLF